MSNVASNGYDISIPQIHLFVRSQIGVVNYRAVQGAEIPNMDILLGNVSGSAIGGLRKNRTLVLGTRKSSACFREMTGLSKKALSVSGSPR